MDMEMSGTIGIKVIPEIGILLMQWEKYFFIQQSDVKNALLAAQKLKDGDKPREIAAEVWIGRECENEISMAYTQKDVVVVMSSNELSGVIKHLT